MNRRIVRRVAVASLAMVAAIEGCTGTDDREDAASKANDGGLADSQQGVPPSGNTESGVDSGTSTRQPTLGLQFDRVGRPAIGSVFNGMVVGAFDDDPNVARAAYAADSDEASWIAKYAPGIARNLPLYDAIFRCGDQFLCNQPALYDVDASTIPAEVGPYASLAALLADDRLWLNVNGFGPDDRYWALELNAAGRPFNSGFGGRKLTDDVVDKTFSNFVYNDSVGYTDQAERNPDKIIDTAAFPFVVKPTDPDGSAPARPVSSIKPEAQLHDLYMFMDSTNLVFLVTVYPIAPPTAQFATDVEYVIHGESGLSFGATTGSVDIVCTFDTTQMIQCWAGDEYIAGDPSARAGGILSESKRLRVYAGLSGDPSFVNVAGFLDGTGALKAASAAAASHDAGCPLLDGPTQTNVRTRFQHDGDGGHGEDFFANLNALALVIEVDPSIVSTQGKIISAWASTNAKP